MWTYSWFENDIYFVFEVLLLASTVNYKISIQKFQSALIQKKTVYTFEPLTFKNATCKLLFLLLAYLIIKSNISCMFYSLFT
jgi:hypothetical protein